MSNEASRWSTAIRDSRHPAYIAIADAIEADVQSGKLVAMQKLPTLRSIADALDLNFTTVARGYAEAQRRGLLHARAGSGTYVSESTPREPVRHAAPAAIIDMTMNMPPEPRDPELLRRLQQGMVEMAEHMDPFNWLRYEPSGGTIEDREAGQHWLSGLIPDASANRILLCPGVQSGLLAMFSMFARPGDNIACEAVTYPGIKGIASQLGIRLVGLPADDEGIDPEALGAMCASDPPKALYLNPTFNNPTTSVMSAERRAEVAEIVRRYNIPIIEDDPYGCLPLQRPAALATLVPELTFYISGFAKCVGAGMRIGYLLVPNVRYAARLSAILGTMVVMTTPIMSRLATRWINDGTVKMATDAIRDESRYRQQLASRILTNASYASKPEAFHLWLDAPQSCTRIEFASYLRAHGVGVVVSDSFTVTGTPPDKVRVCLGGPVSRKDCEHILELIEDAIEHAPSIISHVM
jgi:DNA-binding transcriptional MocR family regulator